MTERRAADIPAPTAYIGLGSNLGETSATLHSALAALGRLPRTELVTRSRLYRSAPVDAAGPDYLNAVAALCTRLDAFELLAQLQSIEHAHGRQRPFRNAPRSLDLDLLLYADQVIDTPALRVPHPRMHERAFVLRPLADIAPQLVIPGRGSVADLLQSVAAQRVEPIAS
jgi:2-amino-4-hydroxy-6-hydroxymethyldihydropteridine diphosphokinase